MQKQQTQPKTRKGDTGRTSSQGRKLSSGGNDLDNKKGDPKINEKTKNPVKEERKKKKIAR